MKKNDNTKLIFLIISIWYIVNNVIWWQINTPIIPDTICANHFNNIFDSGYLFVNAPLVTYIMRFMFFIFGKEYYDLIVIFVNYIFFLVPLYFVYKIAVELKDKQTGNIAMILFAMAPAVYGMSRQYGHQEYHIIAGITFNIYCLIKTNYFKDQKWSIIYGISVGLGLMIKDEFLAYFFVPFIYIVIQSLRQNIKVEQTVNILLSIAFGSFIAGWHYFRLWVISKIFYEPITEPSPIFNFDSMRVMTIGLWEELVSLPIFIIFIIGLIWFILKYKNKYKYIIMLWLIVPWLIIMFMRHFKLPEYGAGFIPAMVLIGAIWLSNINKMYVKKIIMIFVVIIGLLQYIDFSYGIDTKLFNMKLNYGNHKISYYNKDNDLIMYHNIRGKLTLQLIKYLKDNYSNSTVLIYDFLDNPIDYDTMRTLMDINDIKYIFTFFADEKGLSADIIIHLEKIETVQEMTNKYKGISDTHPSINSKIYYERVISPIEKMQKKIDNNFYIIDTFYLGNIQEEKYKVILLGKKDKFPNRHKRNSQYLQNM